ncbi:MAG TPA: ABC transporter substrate-binding protein [Pyrinomonadaceae bacterium]|jgi:ABC-type branched-subunit amino acid transport system substrate-binding protein
MFKSLKFAARAFAFACLAALGAGAQVPAPDAAAARSLTVQERRGRAVYLRGESPSGREIAAVVGELDVPATTMTCAGCHGARGEGKTEGGVTAGSLTWSHLLKPYGHTHPTGRKHGPFNESAFIRAVTGGVDPAGNNLLAAMPRFRMSAEDMADLIAYLKRIETDRDPGLTDTGVEVGVVLPSKGALAETGESMRRVLAAFFEDLNARGGIYSRKVTLRIFDAAGASSSSSRQSEQIFAFVGGISAGSDAELAAHARAEEVPVVGPSTLMPEAGTPPNRYVFYLLAGVAEQARALANFAATKSEPKQARAAVLYGDGAPAAAAAAAAEEQLKKAGWGAVTRRPFKQLGADGTEVARRLKNEGSEAVFIFGAGGAEGALVQEAAASGWSPRFFFLGVLDGRELLSTAPTTFKGGIFLAFPTVPSDVTPAGLSEFRALLEKHRVEPRHTAAQLSAFAAAKIFVEGLQRAGRDLTRERLLTALEGLYEFETGVTPRLTFGPNRRVGAAGAYIMLIDPEKKEFVPASGWVKAY